MYRDHVYNRLKELGFYPKNVIDGGACLSEWTGNIRHIFPESKIMSIDASDWHKNGSFNFSDISEIQVLSDKDNDEVIFYKKVEGLCTGDSLFKEDTIHYAEHNTIEEKRQTITLDTLCDKHGFDKVDLLKLDTQGSEILIMKGMSKRLKDVEFIELECSLAEYNLGGCLIHDVIDFLKEDFVIYEILDLHRHHNKDLIQVDLVFQNKKSQIVKLK